MKLPQHIIELNRDVLGEETTARTPSPWGIFKSKLEKKASETWVRLNLDWWLYEPFTLKFPGGTYTPDFFGPMHNPMQDDHYLGPLAAIEVKGWNKNLRADRLKFKAAAEHHRWLNFCWLTYKKDDWTEDWYTPRSDAPSLR